MTRLWQIVRSGLIVVSLAGLGGCGMSASDIEDIIDTGQEALVRTVHELQQSDPRTIERPDGAVEHDIDVVLEQDVTVIEDLETDVIIAEVDLITILGFENQTDYDVYVDYLVDGVPQTAYVLAGDTLLLEYDCFDEVEITGETDIDAVTGEYLGDRTYYNRFATRPADFVCGDMVVFPIGPNGTYDETVTVEITVEIQQDQGEDGYWIEEVEP